MMPLMIWRQGLRVKKPGFNIFSGSEKTILIANAFVKNRFIAPFFDHAKHCIFYSSF